MTPTFKYAALAGVGFVVLAVGIVVAAFTGLIGGPLALLALIALLGLYVGFGVLIAVYRFTSRLK
jgi:hypothetical protein